MNRCLSLQKYPPAHPHQKVRPFGLKIARKVEMYDLKNSLPKDLNSYLTIF